MRPQRFATYYIWISGTLMIIAETFVVFIRMSDGYCEKFTYAQLGFQ